MTEQNKFILSKQILCLGTSIRANIEDVSAAQSKKDFISKMAITQKKLVKTIIG